MANNFVYLTTKQLPDMTGLSTSFFEKGRVYGYGPPYYKIGGKVLYKSFDVNAWFESALVHPEGSK